jgi:hypothetical protein
MPNDIPLGTMITPKAMRFVDGPHYASSYANNVGFAVNQLDFVLIFGEVVDVSVEEAVVERRARITMSPSQGKALMLILSRQIEAYEKINGEIKLPAGFEENLDAKTLTKDKEKDSEG